MSNKDMILEKHTMDKMYIMLQAPFFTSFGFPKMLHVNL